MKTIVVIGGGITGVTTAYALARRGYAVTLYEKHRYAAMDTVFQGIQEVMAKQNGPESTRYCGGCHDPVSLFSGAKNMFAENLTRFLTGNPLEGVVDRAQRY